MNVSAQNVSSLWQFHGVRSKCGRDGEKRGGAWSGELLNPEKHTETPRNKKGGFSSSFSPAGRGCGGAIGKICDFKDFLLGAASASPMCVFLLWAQFPRYIAKRTLSFSQYRCPDTDCSFGPSSILQIQEVGLLWGYCLLYLFFLPVWIFSCATRSVSYAKELYLARQSSISKLISFQINLVFWTNLISDHLSHRDWPGLISFSGLPARTK